MPTYVFRLAADNLLQWGGTTSAVFSADWQCAYVVVSMDLKEK
ncbi:MAG: hypothetical protein ACR5LD_03650 [Symbiopectobacterium sp.]